MSQGIITTSKILEIFKEQDFLKFYRGPRVPTFLDLILNIAVKYLIIFLPIRKFRIQI